MSDFSLEEHRELFRGLTLMDNEFMSLCFAAYPECAQAVLRIIMGAPDLLVQKVETQEYFAHPAGRSVRTDITATDAEGRKFAVEIQNSDDGLLPLRASYYLATLRATSLPKGKNFDELPETYVIFITARDTFGLGCTSYRFERFDAETGLQLGDKAHIMFVNGARRGEDGAVERLLHDMFCPDPEQMYTKELAHAVRDIKTTKKGECVMSDAAEKIRAIGREEGRDAGRVEGRAEGRAEGLREAVRKLVAAGAAAPEAVARVLGIDEAEVRTLAAAQ